MSLETDLLIDRRRLKRRAALWRTVAVGVVLAGAVLLGVRAGGDGAGLGLGGRVARLAVEGFIDDDRRVIEALERAGRDDSVRALIVAIDSPGGSVAGGEGLHRALSRLAERKPVVAVMGGTAASAGYMVALPAARVFAREATVTGSIGVLLQAVEASELLARLGVRAEVLASGPLKAQPNPLRPLSDEGREALTRVVADLHDQFVGMVVRGRSLPEERVRALADGRVYTGRQALALGLVDAVGGEAEARAWLAAERGVAGATPVRDLEIRRPRGEAFGLGLSGWIGGLLKSVVSEGVAFDAPRALWQPRDR